MTAWRAGMRSALVATLGLAASLFAASSAHAAEEPAQENETPAALRGARVQVGALMLAHVRQETGFDKEAGTLAPGGALAVVWRVEGWELGPIIRGAHFDEPHFWSTRKTTMMSAGGRARWFAFPSSGVTPFVDVGPDLLVLAVDDAANIGPSLHAGAGFEVFHNHAHHRLRFDVGVDVPTFALAKPEVSVNSPACAGCGRSSASDRLYLVPGTVAATWTF